MAGVLDVAADLSGRVSDVFSVLRSAWTLSPSVVFSLRRRPIRHVDWGLPSKLNRNQSSGTYAIEIPSEVHYNWALPSDGVRAAHFDECHGGPQTLAIAYRAAIIAKRLSFSDGSTMRASSSPRLCHLPRHCSLRRLYSHLYQAPTFPFVAFFAVL